MALDRADGEVKAGGDRLVGEPVGYQRCYLQLAWAQAGRRNGARPRPAEREGYRVVDAEPRSLCPYPLGIAAKRSLALCADAVEPRSEDRRELAADPGSHRRSGGGELQGLGGSERASTLACPSSATGSSDASREGRSNSTALR